MNNSVLSPLNEEQLKLFTSLTANFTKEQLLWVSGYIEGLSAQSHPQEIKAESPVSIVNNPTELTVLYGSRTGNGEGLSKKAKELAMTKGFNVSVKNMADYKSRDLEQEKNLIVIVSTHGEGVPPFSAKGLHEFIFSKRAPKLSGLNYAVLALGDSNYYHFCETGKQFDEQLSVLGGNRIVPRIACDVDFENAAHTWLENTLDTFAGGKESSTKASNQYRVVAPLKASETSAPKFTKKNPFLAPVLEKIGLHGKDSDRQTIHIELSTTSAGLEYQPGDSAGILPLNTSSLIEELLAVTQLNGETEVEVNGTKKSLSEALRRDVELSKITNDVLGRYLEFSHNEQLFQLRESPYELQNYMEGRDVIDLFLDFPVKLEAQNLITMLRPLQPRYYSISSSPKAFPGELHLTVGVVKYKNNGRDKHGACSNYLSEVKQEDEFVPLFIESNPNFRLPEDERTPIIMIGAGTGIAPYRAFIQERELSSKSGKSWLFFGNRNFESEFLYQTEWQQHIKSGSLTRMDVAFSRDSEEKIYVQYRVLQHGAEIYQWIQEGAHIYICGDMKKMANDVQATLAQIVEKYGALTPQDAEKFMDNLQKEKRLQLDVY